MLATGIEGGDTEEEEVDMEKNEDSRQTRNEHVEEMWSRFCKSYQQTAEEVIGFKNRIANFWITWESWKMIEERKANKTAN